MKFVVNQVVPILIGIVLSVGMLFCVKKNITNNEKLMIYKVQSTEDVVRLFPMTVREIDKLTDIYLQEAKKAIDAIVVIPDIDRTFMNTVKAYDDLIALSNLAITSNAIEILDMVSPEKEIRTAAHHASLKMQEFIVEYVSNNTDLYNALKAYAEGNAHSEDLSIDQRYYLEELMDNFRRNGLDLPRDKQQKVKTLKKELAALTQDFDAHIAQDNSTIIVDQAGLSGLEEEFISGLEKTADGLYVLGIDYPTYFNVMENCTDASTRKKMYLAFVNRAYAKNTTILERIIARRDELAKILGFKSYASLDLDAQMVKTPMRAEEFLLDLVEKSREKEQREFELLTAELPPSVILSEEGKLQPWDGFFVRNAYKKKYFNIDEQEIACYFPMEKTIEGLLDIYKQFLSVNFEEVPVAGTWHDEVKLVQVYTKDNKLLGYLFLDLHPRPNKYSHACHVTIIPSTIDASGTAVPAVSLVIANFPKSTEGKPSLLKRNDVKTFFHEFGHALHALLGRTSIASLAGTNVKRDFVELPSQMLEEWLYDKQILKKISSHYRTSNPLPDETIEKIIALKNVSSGQFVQGQSFYGLLSLAYFSEGGQKDVEGIMHNLYKQIKKNIAYIPEDHMYAAFGHLTGYGAKYYGYLWSKVFALDLFQEIKKHGLLDPAIGKKYIQEIIGKGGSRDPNQLLQAFLGREPNQKAFLNDLGL